MAFVAIAWLIIGEAANYLLAISQKILRKGTIGLLKTLLEL
jgi:hypothetical protein